jgi:hypothetical protein
MVRFALSEAGRTPAVPDKPKSPPICVFCKLPIRPHQRPSVRLEKEKEAHMECYVKANEEKKTSP